MAAHPIADGVGRYLTIADAAELLTLSAAQVLELIRSGSLAAVRTDSRGRWRIEPQAIEDYLDDRQTMTEHMELFETLSNEPLPEIFGGRRTM
ncbi:helix-turn-helix domain-containing protein [Microbacteriaceae bacterium VKM Ac-2855]|nr:helix-turn-helix domain-containing protein [Microbacteriaceae bacterium VKM Ac-2855]